MGRRRVAQQAAAVSTTPPDSLVDGQFVARVHKAEGSNTWQCVRADGTTTVLAELAAMFRNNVWVRRGGYVLVQPYDAAEGTETTRGNGNGRPCTGEIVNIVLDEKEWRKMPYWPAEFTKKRYAESDDDSDNNVGKLPPSDDEQSEEEKEPSNTEKA